jgi:hypothetical protein
MLKFVKRENVWLSFLRYLVWYKRD